MQADAGFVQHIEHPGGAVAHGAGQLHALALSGGKGRGRTVQREIAQPQVHQSFCRAGEGFHNVFRHRAHLCGQAVRHTLHPADQLRKGHPAGLIQREAPQLGGAGRCRKAGAMARRANVLFQELFYPLHAFFVLDLGQRVFHGVGRIEIGKVQFPCLIGILVVIENVLFLRRTVEHDLLFLRGQVPEGHIGAHAHLPADVGHQRPHQAVPRGHGTLVDGQGIIRHQRSGSTVRTVPMPPHCGQAPCELKASSSADGARNCAPHSGQSSSFPAATRSDGAR